MYRQNNRLRVDTDGANESHVSPSRGPPLQVESFDPFAFIAAAGNASGNTGSFNLGVPNFSPITSPATPITMTFGDVLGLASQINSLKLEAQRVKALEEETANLRGMVKDLNIKIEEEKSKNRATNRDADVAPAGTPSHSRSLRITTPASGAVIPHSGVNSLPRRPALSSIPPTPTTPGMRHGASTGRRTGGTTRGRHRRTQTPTQSVVRGAMGLQSLFNNPRDRQDDRGLLSDFFDGIKAWANNWTQQMLVLSPEAVSNILVPDTIVHEFFGKSLEEAPVILADDYLRTQVVAGVTAMQIAYYTLCENFLRNSGFEEANQADHLLVDYSRLFKGDVMNKHKLLLEQKALYAAIKEKPDHRTLRAAMAKKFSKDLIDKLGELLRQAPAASRLEVTDRDYSLQELFIKGYRIGFRMRMEAAKWRMAWPLAGDDYDHTSMVNESRLLHGDVMKTVEMTSRTPTNYAVRFAMSPTMAKTTFAGGVEQRETIHKGMVHLARKAGHIGAEREAILASARY